MLARSAGSGLLWGVEDLRFADAAEIIRGVRREPRLHVQLGAPRERALAWFRTFLSAPPCPFPYRVHGRGGTEGQKLQQVFPVSVRGTMSRGLPHRRGCAAPLLRAASIRSNAFGAFHTSSDCGCRELQAPLLGGTSSKDAGRHGMNHGGKRYIGPPRKLGGECR